MNTFKRPFKMLMDDCLLFSSKDQVLIVYDENFLPYLDALIDVLEDKEAISVAIFLPIISQRKMAKQGSLPNALKRAIEESTIVLSLLNNEPSTTAIRKMIVVHCKSRCKLAHLPGLNEDVLKLIAVSPFEKIEALSEAIAWALGEADNAELITYNQNGGKYTLTLELEGWNNEPFMSTGIIMQGSWGNALPGETFCCPPHEEVNGKICINGSLPGVVLDPAQPVVLEFVKGKLVNWETTDTRAAAFFENHKARARRNKDSNWNVFAELGFGLNKKIKKLTGNPLYDEKMANTIHIALGDNSGFGFGNTSKIHEDLVIRSPTVKLNGRPLLNKGKLCENDLAAWRRERPPLIKTDLANESFLLFTAKIYKDAQGRVLRKCSRAGRVCYVDMFNGTDPMPSCFLELVNLLETSHATNITFNTIRDNLQCSTNDLSYAVKILEHYKIIAIRKL